MMKLIKKSLKRIWRPMMSLLLKIITFNYKLQVEYDFKTSSDTNSYSQYGQDVFVLKKIFQGREAGFFVDIGANHPILINNTYLLELNNWKGLAIEPQKNLNELWPEVRTTKCLDYVIGSENKIVNFVEGNNDERALSGVEGYNKCSSSQKKISMEQRKLSDILSENSIEHIDYLSVDVEGYEMNVLRSIDFSKVYIKLIGIENDIGFKKIPIIGKSLGAYLGNNKLRNFLKNKDYTYIARIGGDDFFIRK